MLQRGGLAPFSDDAEASSSDDEGEGRVHGSSFNRHAAATTADCSSTGTAAAAGATTTSAASSATNAAAAASDDDDVTAAVSSTTSAASSSFTKSLACQLRRRTEAGSFRLSECADVGAHFVPNALHSTIARYGERVST